MELRDSVYGGVCNNIPETPTDILIKFVRGLYSVFHHPHVYDHSAARIDFKRFSKVVLHLMSYIVQNDTAGLS